MADLIDRQTIIETIHSAIYPYFCGAEDGDALSKDEKLVLSVNKAVCTAIKALPSADAVEVVRCKDCYHYDEESEKCILNNSEMKPMDYCSYGSK